MALSTYRLTLRVPKTINPNYQRLASLRTEKGEISARQAEVQALLDETGKKYQEAMGKGLVDSTTAKPTGASAELAGARGLESLGTTPRRADEEQGLDDE